MAAAERASTAGSNTNSGTTVLGRRERGGERRVVMHAQVAREQDDRRAHAQASGEPESTTGSAAGVDAQEGAVARSLGLRGLDELSAGGRERMQRDR